MRTKYKIHRTTCVKVYVIMMISVANYDVLPNVGGPLRMHKDRGLLDMRTCVQPQYKLCCKSRDNANILNIMLHATWLEI